MEHGSTPSAMEFLTKKIGPYTFHLDSIIYSWFIIIGLIVIVQIARRSSAVVPKGLQTLLELVYLFFQDLAEGMMGKEGRKYTPFATTIFLYVLFCNWIGLIPGLIPPSRDINTTFSMAIISFVAFNYFGIRKAFETTASHAKEKLPFFKLLTSGFWKWFSHFFQPTPTLWHSLEGAMKYILVPLLCVLFFFLNVVEEVARIISLTMRLMGNIMGEHLVISSLLVLTITMKGILSFLFFPISSFVTVLGALTGGIQAFIFAVLTLSYISLAVAEEH